jgi:hypothetical protein
VSKKNCVSKKRTRVLTSFPFFFLFRGVILPHIGSTGSALFYFLLCPFFSGVIFPHIGSATVATREKMALMAADNLVEP